MKRRTFLSLFAGAAWPETEAETLSGRKVTLPAVFGGKPAVVVWSFSKGAGEKSQAWLAPLHKEGWNAWGAAMLEAAPRFIRPMIRGGMKKDMPAALQDRQLLLYKDEKGWRARLSVKDDALPLLVVLDAAGNVAWSRASLFDPQVLAEVNQRLR
jgi:hypothetical protein